MIMSSIQKIKKQMEIDQQNPGDWVWDYLDIKAWRTVRKNRRKNRTSMPSTPLTDEEYMDLDYAEKRCFTLSGEYKEEMMEMRKEINFYGIHGQYFWLSNFYESPQVVDGILFISNEHYFQSQKSEYPQIQKWIREAPSPYLAKKAGRIIRQQEGFDISRWEQIKAKIMYKGLKAKFEDENLKWKLIDTGNAILHEDSPTDTYWGKRGQDMLGKILMEIRSELM